LIADTVSLHQLIERLAHEPVVAVDTEADSLHSYFEKICLVQVGYGDENRLIDPLTIDNLEPFFAAIEDKRLIFHGADYDLRLINRRYDFNPHDLFDTMIAARLCGFKELGLVALVEKYFDVKLSKSSQKANWAQRPLPTRMVEYARNDTRYLRTIAERLEEELRRLARWEWFTESRDRMIEAAREPHSRDDATAWRIRGSHALPPRAQSVLHVLWQWRDTEAARWDRPAFHVINNEALLAIALKAIAGEPFTLPPRMTPHRRDGLMLAVAHALDIPASEWPRRIRTHAPRPTEEYTRRVEKLRALRDKKAAALAIDPAILAPRQALEATAADPASDALMHWQRELLEIEG